MLSRGSSQCFIRTHFYSLRALYFFWSCMTCLRSIFCAFILSLSLTSRPSIRPMIKASRTLRMASKFLLLTTNMYLYLKVTKLWQRLKSLSAIVVPSLSLSCLGGSLWQGQAGAVGGLTPYVSSSSHCPDTKEELATLLMVFSPWEVSQTCGFNPNNFFYTKSSCKPLVTRLLRIIALFLPYVW